MTLPILYSFRRCPYAMRARMAIKQAGITIRLREVLLRDKPDALFAISPKGTVPVLQCPDGMVIDESIEIMLWACEQHDPKGWMQHDLTAQLDWIHRYTMQGGPFKKALDRFKYHDRYTENEVQIATATLHEALLLLEKQVQANGFIFKKTSSLADIAIFPFIRQLFKVDMDYFTNQFADLYQWLCYFLESELFLMCMEKFPVWVENQGDTEVEF